MTTNEINYWVVGSMLGGNKEGDISQDCIERGYWYCWENPDLEELTPRVEEMRNMLRSMKQGDRIAIKKQLGTGENAPFMEIRAIGIVKVVDTTEWRVYVDWLLPQQGDTKDEMGRRVPKKGPGGITSISGPYKNNEANYLNFFVFNPFFSPTMPNPSFQGTRRERRAPELKRWASTQ